MKPVFILSFVLILSTGCKRATEVDSVPPLPPQGLSTVSLDNAVDISWLPSQEADISGYSIWRNGSANGRFVLIGTTHDTYFVDDAALNGTTYYYRLSAYDRAGNESALSAEVAYDTPRPEGYGVLLADQAVNPASSGYDFSAFTTRRYDDSSTDLFFENAGGINYFNVWSDTDIQDMGYTSSLDEISSAPVNGWAPSKSAEAIPGHTYVIWTWDDHYAKVLVKSVTAGSITFDWAYQTAPSNRELKRVPDADGKRRSFERITMY